VRILSVHRDVDRARVVAHRQHLLPRLAAVLRAIDTALLVGAEDVAEHGHVGDVWILRVDPDVAYEASFRQADVLPRLARVGRLVHSVTERHVAARARRSGAHVNDARVRFGDVDGADGPDADLSVGHWDPLRAGVGRLEHTARGAHIEDLRIGGHARRG